MRLLFDQNLSPKLVALLTDLHPGAAHVRTLGMRDTADTVIWDYARLHGFTIISKDGDFRQMSMLFGAPPKVVWLRIGNARTGAVEALIRREHGAIRDFIVGSGALFVVDPR